MLYRRRELVVGGIAWTGALALGPSFWRQALASTPAAPGPGPYGPLGAADANGLRLPAGFKSRVVARGSTLVANTAYQWHAFSDGAATFATEDGGWILVSNSEVPGGQGGASAIRFGADGTIRDAYRILGGTNTNCAGGPTPWGTWLSCEEVDNGRVWECDPTGQKEPVVHPALGVFKHEAVCVDPDDGRLYLTEDIGDSGLYRFTPRAYPSLRDGVLEIAAVRPNGFVDWRRVPDPLKPPIRKQVPGYTLFRRGEGIWFDSGVVYVATTSDDRVYTYDTITERLSILYNGKELGAKAPLHEVDNVTVAKRSGDIYVSEDADDLNICLITPEREVAAFMQATGSEHNVTKETRSEITGPAFDPSGTRLYFSSQRAFGPGVIYEVTGPFRRESRDVLVPDLRLDVPSAAALPTVRARGLLVAVRSPEPASITVALRAVVGGRKRTLARTTGRLDKRGTLRLRLRLTRSGRTAIRTRRSLATTVSARAVDGSGNSRTVVEPVRLRAATRAR